MQALAAEFSGSARKIPLLFRLKQALKPTRSVGLRAL
jgi:hypothetical protein